MKLPLVALFIVGCASGGEVSTNESGACDAYLEYAVTCGKGDVDAIEAWVATADDSSCRDGLAVYRMMFPSCL